MPIVHSVLIKVKPDVDSSGFVDLATSIISQSPTVSSFKVGHAINDPAKNKGFNFTIILEFEDEEVGFATYSGWTHDAECILQSLLRRRGWKGMSGV
jgi:hypothetical protein